MTQSAAPKVPWIISFQRKDLLTACWGGEKEANLLYHFLNKASWEVKNQGLESCKVIPFKEEHDEILELVPMAEGTLIKYLKRFNLAGYVSSGRYGSTYTVNVEAIKAAFTNPPEKPLSAPRGRPKGFKISRINKTKKSETLEENTETSRIIEHEEVSRLNEKVLSLELEVLSLKEKVLNLELLVLNLKLSETRESTPEDAGEAKVSLQNDLEMIQNDLEIKGTYGEQNSEPSQFGADAPTHTPVSDIPYLPDFLANQDKILIADDNPQPASEKNTPVEGASVGAGYEKTPAKQKGSKGSGRTSKKAAEPEAIILSPKARMVFDAWCSLFKVEVSLGPANAKAAEDLVQPLTVWGKELRMGLADLLKEIMNWLYTNDKKGFYKRGVKLFDISREFEGWQSAKEREINKNKPQQTPTLPSSVSPATTTNYGLAALVADNPLVAIGGMSL